jgi:outer membrane receptor protein involved in Fe transport
MTRPYLLCSCAGAALALAATPALAQTGNPDAAAEAAQTPSANQPADIIVTGSARPQRRFDVSYAINSLSAAEIEKLAPRTYSDLLATVPGIQVESSGGEAQEITRIRGLPGDRFGFVTQQDGMPLYHDIDGTFFNSGDGMNRLDLMTERVEIVRGGPSPIYASSAAAIANNITVSGTQHEKGAAELTVGQGGLYRLDAMQSGPLNASTTYAIGGFYRYNDGLRDNGFPTDRGGQIRANIKHEFSNGFVKVSAEYMNDHNVFDLPVPISVPPNAGTAAHPTVNPGASLNQYINYFTGTMNTPSLRDVNIAYYQNGVLKNVNRDLANGRHMQFGNVGLQYQGDFDGTIVSFKSSLTKGHADFDAFYSTSNPVDANAFAASELALAQKAFPGTTSLGYAIAGTNGATPYNPYTASGLVVQGQYRYSSASFYSVDNDLSATHSFQTGIGTHDVKAGAYVSFWGSNFFYATQDYLTQVQSQPQTLDLLAYSASGQMLGSVTQNGQLHDTTGLYQGQTDAKMLALYLNDTWAITDKLKLDAGIRHEWLSYTGYDLNSSAQPLPGSTVAATFAQGFNGTSTPISMSPKATNWTVGLNYDFNHRLGMYGRASHLEVPPELSAFLTTTPTANPLSFQTTKADQYEIGVKAVLNRSYIYLTGYYTRFNPLNESFTAFNPQTGANTSVSFYGTAEDKGLEADGKLALGRIFSLDGSLTLADPIFKNFNSVTGASGAAIYGKLIPREPKIYGRIRPNADFSLDADTRLNLYVTYDYTGKRYVDVLNTTALPAYGTFGAGFIVNHGTWMLQAVGQNLTNAHGLTEGNTRTDNIVGQGTPNAVYGRPIYGRNWRIIVKKSW